MSAEDRTRNSTAAHSPVARATGDVHGTAKDAETLQAATRRAAQEAELKRYKRFGIALILGSYGSFALPIDVGLALVLYMSLSIIGVVLYAKAKRRRLWWGVMGGLCPPLGPLLGWWILSINKPSVNRKDVVWGLLEIALAVAVLLIGGAVNQMLSEPAPLVVDVGLLTAASTLFFLGLATAMGFSSSWSLVDLLMVTFILAILWAIALPAHTDYLISHEVAEGTIHIGKVKEAMIRFADKNRRWPQNNEDIDTPESSTSYGNKVKSIVIDDGKIVLTFSELSLREIKNKSLVFTPRWTKDGVEWVCTSDQLSAKYFSRRSQCQ